MASHHSHLSRRTLLARAASSAAAVALAPSVLARSLRGRDKARLAFVGVWNRGWANLSALQNEDVVALCDVDSNHLANAQAELAKRSGGIPAPRAYADFREMLGAEKDLDGVVVSTPDHTHAPASAAAMRRGLHVYCEKPLAHSVHEVRTMQKLAREQKLVTQMGTQIHAGENYRRVVELVRSGAIGDVEAVHVWCGKGWADGRFGAPRPVPANLAWDLWLGPTPERPFTGDLHPANWRKYWAFGGGTLADMACHYVDLVHWALELDVPDEVTASGPELHPDGAPMSLRVRWKHPARGERAAVDVFWYDGDARPDPNTVPAWKMVTDAGAAWGAGHMWVGSEGILVSNYGRHVLLPEAKFAGHVAPPRTIDRSVGHHAEWVRGITDGSPTTCNFEYSGALAETVLLGCAAYRTGGDLAWDGRAGKPKEKGVEDIFLAADYREGWAL